MKRLFQRFFVVTVLALVFSLGPQVSQASAACRTQVPAIAGDAWDENNTHYFYTQQYTVPSWSTCNDINIRNLTYGDGTEVFWAQFRVRFYPSSGGNYANGWTITSSQGAFNNDVEIAYDVLNGTKYRVEYGPVPQFWGSPYYYHFYLKD